MFINDLVQFLHLVKNIGFVMIGIVFNDDYKDDEDNEGNDDKGKV